MMFRIASALVLSALLITVSCQNGTSCEDLQCKNTDCCVKFDLTSDVLDLTNKLLDLAKALNLPAKIPSKINACIPVIGDVCPAKPTVAALD